LLQIAKLLLENHGAANPDPWLKALVDRREIYLMPMANPWGHRRGVRNSPGTEGSEDMNRDHLYDRCTGGGFCGDDVALSTVGGRAIHELARRHNFRVMLDYHGGIELIIHPWGSPLHLSDSESPDDRGHDLLGQRMSDFGGNFNGAYPVGTSNDLLGPVHAPLDDTAYASGWDPANAATEASETPGWRALSYTVEISNQKRPPVGTLGGDADLLTPGGAEDGYVPKNVRIGLAAVDSIEPWVEWINRDAIPTAVSVGETITLEWSVRGCFQIDETRVRFGADLDPLSQFDGQTPAQQQTTGDPCWLTPTVFTADVTFQSAGEVSVTPVAQVDTTLLTQSSPVPNVGPAGWLARSRTEDGLLVTNTVDPNETSTVVGQTFWGAEPLRITVSDGVIFEDGFESGDTGAWSASSP
ncbi:MAG: M14 family zinc carboxypeptidase, partial [Acidobacteriota bacterium]